MRRVSAPRGDKLVLTTERRTRLRDFLINEHMKIISGRAGLEKTWRECLRMYQGSTAEKRWVPFENAPAIEITIGALAADAIYAQGMDLIFQINPPVTIRSRKRDFDDHADAMQEYVDWGVSSKRFNFRGALKTALLDDVQLGTMVAYIPWVKTVRKTGVYPKIIKQGPRSECLDPKDFLVSLNCGGDVQTAKICTMRLWMEKGEFNLNSRLQNWIQDDGGGATESQDPVGRDRLKLAGLDDGLNTGSQGKLYEICDTFCYFDIDEDGIEEDLEIIWNRSTGGILKAMYNRWDSRPFVMASYQDRAHVAYGIGPLEMIMPYEAEITETHNNRIWNMMLANTKMYNVPSELADEAKVIYPGKAWEMIGESKVEPIDMGEVNNAPIQSEMASLALAERRVGVSELGGASKLGGRTPGITALSALQQANRRFFPPFDNMREFAGEMVIQCLLRTQERVLADDSEVIQDLHDILGAEKAQLVIDLFKKSDIELSDALDVEVTASSVSVNREADRQNMMLVLQAYEKYLAGMAQLAQTKAVPPFPGADKVAGKAAEAINRFMFRFLRTFDQISDVQGYLITLDDVEAMGQMGLNGLAGQMSQQLGAQPPQPEGGTPPPQGPMQ